MACAAGQRRSAGNDDSADALSRHHQEILAGRHGVRQGERLAYHEKNELLASSSPRRRARPLIGPGDHPAEPAPMSPASNDTALAACFESPPRLPTAAVTDTGGRR